MSDGSPIEWTDATWNPVRGCTKVSPGCKHCYAETFAERWRGIPGQAYEHGFDLRLVPEKQIQPLTWLRPRRVFVNSMSDLFQAGVPDEFIEVAFEVMALADWHIFQVLTKRADRMAALAQQQGRLGWLLARSHAWLGTSIEDRTHGLPRIDLLRESQAAVRFLSIEPLLEDLGELNLSNIDWVIVGGESGPRARPMDSAWVRDIRDQCDAAGVAFFFKQWGGVQKSKTGRELDGQTYDGFPPCQLGKAPKLRERERRKERARRLVDTLNLASRS